MKKPSVTLSIPVYNDASSLKTLTEEISSFLDRHDSFEISILIIDDCSSDQTFDIANAFAGQNPNAQIIHHSENYGFGPTFKEAFYTPQSDWVFFLTGDNQFPVENLLRLQERMNDCNLIVGRRAVREDNWRRRMNSKIYNAVISLLARRKITDVNSTLLFRREILDKVELNSQSAFINAEFLLKAINSGYSFTEIDIIHKERLHGVGSGGKLNVIFPVIRDVLRYTFGKL